MKEEEYKYYKSKMVTTLIVSIVGYIIFFLILKYAAWILDDDIDVKEH